jgi:Na+-translocating ferredoxin:NAD+ oxidoreductase subunit B
MTQDVYERLARRLDSLPNGFPRTETGVELRILRAIFSPEDAELALKIKPLPESAATIARRLGRPVDEVRAALDGMAERGQIAAMRIEGRQLYVFIPFIVGIYEFQLNRLTKELSDLFEEYAPALMRTVGGSKPSLARVIPVNTRIEARAQVLPHEDITAIFDQANSFRVAQCICRKEKALQGHPCAHTHETCLAFSREENAWEGMPEWGRPITRDEAKRVVESAEQAGLVHATYNTTQDPFFLCNCCSCCCGFLRGVKEFEAPYMLAHSSVVSRIEASTCTACGECAAPRCPMDAIAPHDDVYHVDEGRCIGCGVCLAVCPTDAIALHPRPADQMPPIPKTLVHWSVDRATARHGTLHGLALRGWLAWELAKSKLAGGAGD